MRERQLVRPSTTSSTSTSPSPPQASANVVGALPRSIYDTLTTSSKSHLSPTGSIDATHASLSLLVEPNGIIYIWPHVTQTLSEKLTPANNEDVVKIIHPEYKNDQEGGGGGGALKSNLVTLAPYAGGVHTDRTRKNIGTTTPHSFYACSPDGVLCYWNDIFFVSSNNKPCDASVRLPLYSDEYITCISSSPPSNQVGVEEKDNVVLLGTSRNRIWMVERSARPLELRARLIRLRKTGGEGEDTRESKGGGLLTGIYSTIFGSSPTSSDEDFMEEEENEDLGSDDGIHSILRLSPPPSSSSSKSVISSFVSIQARNTVSLSTYTLSSKYASENNTYYYSPQKGESSSSQPIVEKRHDCIAIFPLLQAQMEKDKKDSFTLTKIEVISSCTSTNKLVLILNTTGMNQEQKTECRFYVLSCNVMDGKFLGMESYTWLSRYSSESIVNKAITCAGSIVVEDEEEKCVVYSAFHSTQNNGGGMPVTISTVSIGEQMIQCCDVDLPSDDVPNLVNGCVGFDTTTVGCVVISTSCVVANTRVLFPDSGGRKQMNVVEEEDVGEEGDVSTLTSHVMSAFRMYQSRRSRSTTRKTSSGGSGSDSNLASLLPPSIQVAKPSSVSQAVVLASSLLCNDTINTITPSSSSPAGIAVQVIQTKLSEHSQFINFLIHAGIYRRVSRQRGRILLRNHGEIMKCIAGMVMHWQKELERLGGGEEESRVITRRSTRSSTRAAAAAAAKKKKKEGVDAIIENMAKVISKSLSGIEVNVTSLSTKLVSLQKDVLEVQIDEEEDVINRKSWALHQISSLLCIGLQCALKYRLETSEILYDLETLTVSAGRSEGVRKEANHWTSGSEMLYVLMNQLRMIKQASSVSQAGAGTPFAEYKNTKMHVDVLAEVLLNGYYEKLPPAASTSSRLDVNEEERLYDEAKKLAIPLVRAYGKKYDDVDEKKALKMSLIHAYFDGIVNICYDNLKRHRRRISSRRQSKDGDDDQSDPYDLIPMLSSPLKEDPSGLYIALNQAIDYSTKLTFRRFVLKWYADRGLYADVLDFGKVCPYVLAQYLEEDGRLREYKWIHSVRTGDYQAAMSCLVGLASDGNDKLLEESKLLLSLGKIANKIAKVDNDDDNDVSMDDGAKTAEEKMIQNNLTLVRAQEILRNNSAMSEHEDYEKFDRTMTAGELLQIALDQANASGDAAEKGSCLVIGLAVAETLQDSSPNDGAWNAAQMWMTSIVSDQETWKNLAEDGRSLLSDENRRRFIEATVFYGVASEYYSLEREPVMDVGFLSNRAVKEHVVAGLNLDEQIVALLNAAAEVAVEDARGRK